MGAKRWEDAENLTPKECEFIEKYVYGEPECLGNATECYKQVYDKDNKKKRSTCGKEAYKLMNKDEVEQKISELMKQKVEKWDNEEWISSKIKETVQKAAHERDKLKGLELLGKKHALFKDKVVTDEDTNLILTNLNEKAPESAEQDENSENEENEE